MKSRGRPVREDDSDLLLSCRWQGCQESFQTCREAREHELFVHFKNKIATCCIEGCGRQFPDDSETKTMKRHFRSVHGYRTHICEYCGIRFVEPDKLDTHYKIHKRRIITEEEADQLLVVEVEY